VALLLVLLATLLPAGEAEVKGQRLLPPPASHLYHGVYPGGKSGAEDDLTAADLDIYQRTVGQPAAWVYFSHNWFKGRAFPAATAGWIRAGGALPFIRLMLRSDSAEDHKEPLYTLDAIIAGDFDVDLKRWGAQAQIFATPLLVEWGTECNGEWFPWNGTWNGADEKTGFGDPRTADGPERFVAAYRHIIAAIRAGGATNIQWVFHPNDQDVPEDGWNRFEHYYPGDEWIDVLAVSVYGPKTPIDKEAGEFTAQLDAVYPRLVKLAAGKPIIVAEFGCAAGHAKIGADRWADAALTALLANRWPGIAGFSWWNERWENGRRRADTTMRVQDTAALGEAFRAHLAAAKDRIECRPLLGAKPEKP
jgi:hypothetical protein